ncbi:hypothetical protein PROSTU_01176 [Providencia stuartii ATCC 25827]|uniref:Uncharacterized protein n=1 Tax=Providencia stuartii ATCC 25827 TaxID=471874 RepID=A0AA86Z247_PROST|nr:hypothetical protein PROSTU_01176 [Providencia stuartii ATCC 25827]
MMLLFKIVNCIKIKGLQLIITNNLFSFCRQLHVHDIIYIHRR